MVIVLDGRFKANMMELHPETIVVVYHIISWHLQVTSSHLGIIVIYHKCQFNVLLVREMDAKGGILGGNCNENFTSNWDLMP